MNDVIKLENWSLGWFRVKTDKFRGCLDICCFSVQTSPTGLFMLTVVPGRANLFVCSKGARAGPCWLCFVPGRDLLFTRVL